MVIRPVVAGVRGWQGRAGLLGGNKGTPSAAEEQGRSAVGFDPS